MPGVVHPDKEACHDISTRLSTLTDIWLPAALLREHPYPEVQQVQQHLEELLHRDAAVFLERYRLLLSAEELLSFEPLRQDYEVDYYLQQAQAALQQQQQQKAQPQGQQAEQCQRCQAGKQLTQLSSTVKNRRLAFMRRLEQQGEYFSEHAMRERQPLVWQECIGRHEGHPAFQAPAAAAGERGFAGSLLASYDEAMLRARLQQQLEEEEAAMSEHESDSDMEDDDGDAVHPAQQHQSQQQQGLAPHQEGQRHRADGSGQAAPTATPRPTAITTPAAASANRTQVAKAGAAGAPAGPQQQQQQGHAVRGPAANVDMSPDAMARRRQEFLLEMQHRFLEGLDDEHHSYAAIDSDVGLDDDFAQQQQQDAEDAYFDAD